MRGSITGVVLNGEHKNRLYYRGFLYEPVVCDMAKTDMSKVHALFDLVCRSSSTLIEPDASIDQDVAGYVVTTEPRLTFRYFVRIDRKEEWEMEKVELFIGLAPKIKVNLEPVHIIPLELLKTNCCIGITPNDPARLFTIRQSGRGPNASGDTTQDRLASGPTLEAAFKELTAAKPLKLFDVNKASHHELHGRLDAILQAFNDWLVLDGNVTGVNSMWVEQLLLTCREAFTTVPPEGSKADEYTPHVPVTGSH
jgi:hypothetical protein